MQTENKPQKEKSFMPDFKFITSIITLLSIAILFGYTFGAAALWGLQKHIIIIHVSEDSYGKKEVNHEPRE